MAVMPGTMRTFSTPRRTRGAHTTSSSCTARKDPEGDGIVTSLGREAHAIVANEHGDALLRLDALGTGCPIRRGIQHGQLSTRGHPVAAR